MKLKIILAILFIVVAFQLVSNIKEIALKQKQPQNAEFINYKKNRRAQGMKASERIKDWKEVKKLKSNL